MAENKLVKTVIGSVVLIGLSAGIGWLGKKILKESFIGDPSTSIMNFGRWVLVLTTSTYGKNYLEDQKILPTSV